MAITRMTPREKLAVPVPEQRRRAHSVTHTQQQTHGAHARGLPGDSGEDAIMRDPHLATDLLRRIRQVADPCRGYAVCHQGTD